MMTRTHLELPTCVFVFALIGASCSNGEGNPTPSQQQGGATSAKGGSTATGSSAGRPNGGVNNAGGAGPTGVSGSAATGGTASHSGGSTSFTGGWYSGGKSPAGGQSAAGGSPSSGGITARGGASSASGGVAGLPSGGGGTSGAGAPPVLDAPSCKGSGTTYYASPTGSGSNCTESAPCSLNTAAGKPRAGDIVCMRGGTYSNALSIPTNVAGTTSSKVTFSAYPGELPIVNGGIQIPGKNSTNLRFNGIATQGGESGFANPLAPSGANGNLEFLNCIADFNTMNGIAFHGAAGLHISQCIIAHTGSSLTRSWSSGVDLWSAQGKPSDNIIERTVSFENVDMECHTDGNGFTVDVNTTGATFVNNIGFRNGGSCFRITGSSNTVMINNTCYDNGLDPQASVVPPNNGCVDITIPAPKYPGEYYFNDTTTTLQGARLYNNLGVAGISRLGNSGSEKQLGVNRTPTSTGNNFTVDQGGTATFFTAPPLDMTLIESAATNIIGKASAAEAPKLDIGFDPRCIVKRTPQGSGVQPWWQYSIDYDYIRSIGGVAYCFHPKTRTNPPDIGAYNH